MTKVFRDVDYFVTEASNSVQWEFEKDFADAIVVFDTDETIVVTEDYRRLTISWDVKGYYKSYFVESSKKVLVDEIIETLKGMEVDGETMQYILEKVGMEDQMLRQLIMSQPIQEVGSIYTERMEFELSNQKKLQA